ncbi:MAG: protoheme IX farnesyltransferase, partial [Candidatus Rokubacteria bacterium]|nr:protoheme IX farnesyltransferase [Candidatus Rokubacteria bacterium]
LRLLLILLGTALAAGGTIALNQLLERVVEGWMERTRRRPLPEGRLRPAEALCFGSAITLAGLLVLLGVGSLPSLVTAATVGLYLFAYTPLKRRSSLCLIVGALPGALPPVVGWVAARGEFEIGGWVLFGILFLWQLPHTLAIARIYREDYARAGIRLLPANRAAAEAQALAGCLALLAVGLLPTLIGLAGQFYLFGALILGVGFLGCSVLHARSPSLGAARRLLFASLLYLPTALILMTLDKA